MARPVKPWVGKTDDAMPPVLTQSIVRNILDYDPETGIFRWRVQSSQRAKVGDIAGWLTYKGYLRISIKRKGYFAHRLAFLHVYGAAPEFVDHVNGNRADNRLCNLRAATRALNSANSKRSARNTSGFKGVSFDKKTDKWRAYITVEKTKLHLGFFETAEAAYEKYVAAATICYREFARLA